MGNDLFVGVDIGGTKVAAGLVNSEGEITANVRVPMFAKGDAEQGLEAILTAVAKVVPEDQENIRGIGICSAGPLDPNAGVVLNPPNLPCWSNYPLVEMVRRKFPFPVKLDNDANGAALAEARWGAGRGYKNVFHVTLGTGIGTGIVLNGEIYHGRTGNAGEGGHVSIDYRGPKCLCGKPGCIEALASGTAIVRRVRERISEGRKSAILDFAGGKPEQITGETVAKGLAESDALACEVMLESSEMLALWLSNMLDVLDPDVVVIGGGAAALYSSFFDQIGTRAAELSINPRADEVPVLTARYGTESGIAGGAALVNQMEKRLYAR